MAFFTDFMSEYRKLQNESEIGRGIGSPTSDQVAALSSRFGGSARADVESRAGETSLDQKAYELASGQSRFQDKVGLAHKKLDVEDEALKKSKEIFPWMVGLNLGNVALSHYGSSQQRRRDDEYRDMFHRILGGNLDTARSPSGREDMRSYREV